MVDSQHRQYHHLFSTNDEPSRTEIVGIRAIVEERGAAIAQLEARIIELEEMLNGLRDRHKREKDFLSPFYSALAPIRRVPQDVLIEIFLFTRDWTNDSSVIKDFAPITAGPYPGRSPLLITHVCSHWRSIALSVPMLWSTIDATYRISRTRDNDGFNNDRLQEWVSRTGQLSPLHITCHGQQSYLDAVSLSLINPHVHRIKGLSLEGAYFELPNEPFDALETLSISEPHGTEVNISAPALRRLGFKGMVHDVPCVPFNQLTHLHLELLVMEVSPSYLFGILSQCLALVYVNASSRMHGYGDGRFVDFAVSDDERVVMGNLETLFIDYTEVPWLFARLTLPALTMLRVESTVWSSFVYQSLQSRSSFSLNSVSLCHVKLGEADFLDLLRDTPSLTEVILCDVLVLTPTLVTSLASNPPYGSPVLGPNLEYLGICWTFIQENESSESAQALNEAILDMISSRDPTGDPAAYMWNGGPPGTKVFTSRSSRQPLCNGEAPNLP